MKILTYKLLLFLKLIGREFKAQKLRMGLTILAITWGTISITLLMAFSVGLDQQFAKAGQGLGNGIVIVWSGQTSLPYQGLPQGRSIRFRTESGIIDLIKSRVVGIDMVAGEFLRWGQTLEYGGKQINKLVCGTYPEYEVMRAHYAKAGGRFINKKDMDLKRRVVYLGTDVAEELFDEGVNPVGEMVKINSIPFTVIGVMIDKLQNSNYHGPDEDYVVIPASTFLLFYGDPFFDNLVYKIEDGIDSKVVEKDLFRVLGAKYRFDPEDESALWIWDTVEEEEISRKVFLGITIFMWFIGGMTLLIAGIGVANIMYVAVRERTKEIGTKIALGAERKHIIFQFMTEALSIAFVGGIVGIGFSVAICSLFRLLPMEGALEFLGKPTVNWVVALTTVLTLSFIGLFAGLFPARKAASINPVEALRYD
ncbi:MAG: ABC transporter permease [candidate division Zixibacteria bacterium]